MRQIGRTILSAWRANGDKHDFSFGDAMREATGLGSGVTRLATGGSVGTTGNLGAKGATDPRHIPLPAASTGTGAPGTLGYSVQTQPSLDNNTVDLDRERANFVDNAVRYEATLRFINGNAKTMLSAIQGQ